MNENNTQNVNPIEETHNCTICNSILEEIDTVFCVEGAGDFCSEKCLYTLFTEEEYLEFEREEIAYTTQY